MSKMMRLLLAFGLVSTFFVRMEATAQTVTASSQIPGWEATRAIDGDVNSTWSSGGHATANVTEWIAVDYGKATLMTGASIAPRPGGGCFPVDYQIQYSTNGTTWALVPGLSLANQSAPSGTLTLTFSNAIIARALRLYATTLSPDNFGNYYLQLAEFRAVGADLWAAPAELRTKKVINAGQYSTLNLNDADAPTPKFLADNPDYLANHPFDGLSIPVPLERQWLTNQGLLEPEYALQDLVMTKLLISWSQVSAAVADLKRVNWSHLTDNFLWYRVSDASASGDFDTRYAVDPSSSNDWFIVRQNAALSARICREANLQGFMLDTEQYTTYASGELYPFGKGTPTVWRQRGQQWIQAVQSEFPGIKIIFFFSWGPESEPGGWPGYENLKYFMNGILDGVQSPARIIHGWESTFWYGATRILGGTPTVYPGDRSAYVGARNNIKNVWRNLSDNPAKYDQFVEAGMAAYVDSDPYNLWPGWPSGYLTDWPWSNLPYTLAYSDSYVWVWAAHTHYSATKSVLNPFLASIASRTFNTGQEPVATFTETFPTDPLRRGWYFDFDMFGIGRELNSGFLPVMDTDSIPYNWESANQCVRVKGAWKTGLFGERTGVTGWQRRRYVRPVQPVRQTNSFHAEFDFKVENFGSDPANPILIGLFNSASLVTSQAIRLRIDSTTQASVTVAGVGVPWTSNLVLSNALSSAATYRVRFKHNGTTRAFESVLTDLGSGNNVAYLSNTVPANLGAFALDEAGIAQWDADPTATAPAQAHEFLLKRAALFPPAAVLSLSWPPSLDGNGFHFLLQGLPGQTYTVQSSSNLVNWSVAGSVVASNAPVTFLDSSATTNARRYYRAVGSP